MSRYTKFITAALAFVGVVLSSGLLTGTVQEWVSCIVAALGAALVYLLPNASDAPTPPLTAEAHGTGPLLVEAPPAKKAPAKKAAAKKPAKKAAPKKPTA
jgi:hypothetical protein